MEGSSARRDLFRKALAGLGLTAVTATVLPGEVEGRGHHKRRRKRCRHHCKNNRKTCDRACNILDGDSRDLCKQGCRVAMSQCRGDC
jgi:hypothetical protein